MAILAAAASLLLPAPVLAAGGIGIVPARVGGGVGDVTLTAGPNETMVLAAVTRRGIVVRRSLDGGRRFQRRRIIARGAWSGASVRAAIDADGAVIVAWTRSDSSIVIDEDRDYEECCDRVRVGGLTAGGRVLPHRRLANPRRRSAGPLVVAVDGTARYVAMGRPLGTRFRDVARVWHATPRGWSRGRPFDRRRSPYRLGFRRVGGRTVLVGADRRKGVRRVRFWSPVTGRGRTVLRLGSFTLAALELSGSRINGLLNRLSRAEAARYLYGFTATGGRIARTRFRRPLAFRDITGDGRGRIVVAGARSVRRPVAIRIVERSGRVGRWLRLGRLAGAPERYSGEVQATAAASGTVTVWGTVATSEDERLVRLVRTPGGRVRRAADANRGSPTVRAVATTAHGPSVAAVEIARRLWLAR